MTERVLWNTIQIQIPTTLAHTLKKATEQETFNSLMNPRTINKIASFRLIPQKGRTKPEIYEPGIKHTMTAADHDYDTEGLLDWGTISILVPDEMLYKNKQGQIQIKQTLTNLKKYPKVIGGVPSIQFELGPTDGTFEPPQILDKGDKYSSDNIHLLKYSKNRVKAIAAKLDNLDKKFRDYVLEMEGTEYEPESVGYVDYDGHAQIAAIALIYLMQKHSNKCIIVLNTHLQQNISPSKFGWGLRMDDDFVNLNENDLANQLIECVRNKAPVIIIPLEIYPGGGHYNILVYRPKLGTIERYEPHGSTTNYNKDNYDTKTNTNLKMLFENLISPLMIQAGFTPITYIPPSDVCPVIDGFQTLEGEIKELGDEGGGFCVMWSLFVADLIMSRPEIPTKTLIRDVMNAAENDSLKYATIIRGYVLELEEEIDRMYKSITKKNFGKRMVSWKNPINVGFTFIKTMLIDAFTKIGKKDMSGFDIRLDMLTATKIPDFEIPLPKKQTYAERQKDYQDYLDAQAYASDEDSYGDAYPLSQTTQRNALRGKPFYDFN